MRSKQSSMKLKLIFLFTCFTMSIVAQHSPLKKIEALINGQCIGSPSDRSAQKQLVRFSVLDKDSVELAAETHELSSGSVLRKNRFHFRLTDIDADHVVIKQFGSFYGVFLYTKEHKKQIVQSVFLAGDPNASNYSQEMVCICDFKDIQTAEELKAELIKAITLHKP